MSEIEATLTGVVSKINSHLVGATENYRFATFALVRLDVDGRLVGVNAGHCSV